MVCTPFSPNFISSLNSSTASKNLFSSDSIMADRCFALGKSETVSPDFYKFQPVLVVLVFGQGRGSVTIIT